MKGIQLQLETIAVCQAKCTFCPYSTIERAKGCMDMDLYKKIVDEAATLPYFRELCLTGLGEPLLDQYLDRRITYAATHMRTPIGIFTNGQYLTPDRFNNLKQAGVSYVVVSLNAITAEKRKEVMGLDDWSTVMENLNYALTNMGRVKVRIHGVAGKNDSERDRQDFYSRYGRDGQGGFGLLVEEGNWGDESRDTRSWTPNECCDRAIEQYYVLWNGKVTPCCFMPDESVVWGDLNTQTLREVYNSEPWANFRALHANDQADEYDFCARCTRI